MMPSAGEPSPGQLKLSLAAYQSKRGRVVPAWEVRRSVGISQMAGLTPEKKWMSSGASIIPEVAGVYIPKEWGLSSYVDEKQGEVLEHGIILRDLSFVNKFPGKEVMPLFSLFSRREDNQEPLIVELWKKSGEPDFNRFIDKFLFKPFLEKNRYLMFHEGIIPEIHAQNLVVVIDPKTGQIEHFFHRDVGSMKIDLRMRWVNGLSVAPLRSENAAFDFKFKRATEVIEEDFFRYLFNEPFVNQYKDVLSSYVSGYNPDSLKGMLKDDLVVEIEHSFPLRQKREFTSIKDHLEQFYAERQPVRPKRVSGKFDTVRVLGYLHRQAEKQQVMELPATWKSSVKLQARGFLVTDYGVVFDGGILDLKDTGKLMLAYHDSHDLGHLQNGEPCRESAIKLAEAGAHPLAQ